MTRDESRITVFSRGSALADIPPRTQGISWSEWERRQWAEWRRCSCEAAVGANDGN